MIPEEMLQEQIERRRQRGLEEIIRIANKGNDPIYSAFDVISKSERGYRVQIRSLTERINSCTCPDYRTNTIGTCKHIEGVLAQLRKKHAGRWEKIVCKAPQVTQLYVHYAERPTVRITTPLPTQTPLHSILSRYFDTEGILQGKVTQSLPAVSRELEAIDPEARQQLFIDPAVNDYLKSRLDIEATEQQKRWFMEQVQQGNRSLNVLSTELYEFQNDGVLHLTFGRRALLADDMGLGKTIQAIAAAALLKQLRDIRHVLVVCPASLKHQWAREIHRFTSLSAHVIEGNPLQRRETYRDLRFFNIVNYELVRFDEKEIAKREFDLVILDEAQRIKNWRTKTADAVKRLRSPYAFVLTGTPLENRLDELYSIFQFIEPTVLGPLWRFNLHYYDVVRRPSGSYRVLGYKNLDELRRRVAPYVVRRLRDDVLLDLPERIDNNFFVEMTDHQWEPYLDYQNTVARLMSKAQRRPLTPDEHRILLSSLTKMRLLCNALALHDPEVKPQDRERSAPKLKELREILLEEVAQNGHKAVIFSQWTMMLDLIEPVLAKLKLGWVKLTGEVPSKKRGALIQRFFDDPGCKVFLSTDAGGVGLNLQAASFVINLDLPWNPAVLEQRIARAHRHGQPRPVQVVNLVAQGTIEERMLDTLAAKRAVFDAALNEDSEVSDLQFADSGQGILQRLEALMGSEERPKPEPTMELEVPGGGEEPKPQPTLANFADLLVGRYPGRILLVRKAPHMAGMGEDGGVLVVVDGEPATIRESTEQLLGEHFAPSPEPRLFLMEKEGYRTLTALTGGESAQFDSSAEFYRAPAMASVGHVSRAAGGRSLGAARAGFETADRRLNLASVVLEGGFPEEVLRPVHQALGWALSSYLSLVTGEEPVEEVPSARAVEAQLVVPGRIPEELAARLERVRILSAPSDTEKAEEPCPTAEAAQRFIDTIRELIDHGREELAKESL